MSGGFAVAPRDGRVRIKGKWKSACRFFMVAVGYMAGWVLLTSLLTYYSKWFGPQVLLEMNVAFYLSSIPVLVLSGLIEKLLDKRYGQVMSMSLRLNVGLIGSAIIVAFFPFTPMGATSAHARSVLLWLVAVLGMLSAIAFSTAYQLVQSFRHADIIALGIGGVGSGPLIMVLQLGLGVGPIPLRWQWISMFEVTAGFVVLGLACSVSLFAQYWQTLVGTEALPGAGADNEPLLLHGSMTLEEAQSAAQEEHAEDHAMMLASAPTSNMLLAPDPFQGLPVLFHSPTMSAASWEGGMYDPPPRLEQRAASLRTDLEQRLDVGNRPSRQGLTRNRTMPAVINQASPKPAQVQLPHQPSSELPAGAAGGADTGSTPLSHTTSAFHSAATEATEAAAGSAGLQTLPPRTVTEETVAALAGIWQVLLAFTLSVTALYLVFPFFTFVPSESERLPQVLFFARIYADIVGRFLPRRKSLVIWSPAALLSLALAKVVVVVLFFLYIKAPHTVEPWGTVHKDWLSTLLVVIIWLAGGYLNTTANILAPSLVDSTLTVRAAALISLAFQVAHFLGLILAAVLMWILYGSTLKE